MGIISEPGTLRQAHSEDSRLKLHLRLVKLRGRTYHVLTLRPGTKIAFSTNFYHGTWHIVSSQQGSQLLARLLWGLSFQRQAGTLLLIHGEHLLPTPFEAERSDPFLITLTGLTQLDATTLRSLKSRLGLLGPPDRTIRLHSWGLDLALNGGTDEEEKLRWDENQQLWDQERMERLGGFICYSAPPVILRQQALRIHRLKVKKGNEFREMDYHFLAEESCRDSWFGDGEVQIFADYMERVASAVEARNELLANPNQPVLSETMQGVISRRRDQIKARRARKRSQLA